MPVKIQDGVRTCSLSGLKDWVLGQWRGCGVDVMTSGRSLLPVLFFYGLYWAEMFIPLWKCEAIRQNDRIFGPK